MDHVVESARTVVFLAFEVKKKSEENVLLSLSNIVSNSYYSTGLLNQIFLLEGCILWRLFGSVSLRF